MIRFLLALLIVEGITKSNLVKAEPVKLDSAAIKIERFKCNREPMTPLRECEDYTGRVAFEIHILFFDVMYWDNDVHVEAVRSTAKTVGWEFEKGLHVNQYIDIYWHHHSRHVMDDEQPKMYNPKTDSLVQPFFPVEDSLGIRINLIPGGK